MYAFLSLVQKENAGCVIKEKITRSIGFVIKEKVSKKGVAINSL